MEQKTKLTRAEKLGLLKNYLCSEINDNDVFFKSIVETLSEKQINSYIDYNLSKLIEVEDEKI